MGCFSISFFLVQKTKGETSLWIGFRVYPYITPFSQKCYFDVSLFSRLHFNRSRLTASSSSLFCVAVSRRDQRRQPSNTYYSRVVVFSSSSKERKWWCVFFFLPFLSRNSRRRRRRTIPIRFRISLKFQFDSARLVF